MLRLTKRLCATVAFFMGLLLLVQIMIFGSSNYAVPSSVDALEMEPSMTISQNVEESNAIGISVISSGDVLQYNVVAQTVLPNFVVSTNQGVGDIHGIRAGPSIEEWTYEYNN